MTSELQPVKPDTAEVLIITGMSGAGRTTAAHSLEDLGWYVVDNLPPQLFSTMAQLNCKKPDTPLKFALVVDVRSKEFFQALQEAMNQLRTDGAELRVLFLDAADEVLVRRFETLRRPHPLQGDGSILEGIAAERELMVALRDQAEMMIDTTDLNVHDLTTATTELFTESGPIIIRLNIMSFGFKKGVPQDSNDISDFRFLTNPHGVPGLRPFTGQDQEISTYVLERKGVASFIDSYVAMMEPVIEGYRSENKHYATLAFGCTGGKHRSVAIAEEIAKRLATYSGVKAKISHRDMGRE